MKKLLVLMLMALVLPLQLMADEVEDRLNKIPGISDVVKLESTYYPDKYVMNITQAVDPKNPAAGTFKQRVILCHVGFDRPTVLVTEGYDANYGLRPSYREELSTLLNANQIMVEYRYFDKSTPTPCNWNYLTVENSLYDLHNVNKTFHQLYKGHWLATGISKGGQTCMFYRMMFPDDVDVSVPYVAPLNRGLEDGRHEPFIEKKVGRKTERDSIKVFQTELLKRRSAIEPMFKAYCDSMHYTFRVPVSEIYDYCVLEAAFALWQWGTPVTTLPKASDTDRQWFDYFIHINEPNYFSTQTPYLSFNVQAARELGYYGYDIKPFKKLMSIKSAKDYMHRVMLPAEFKDLKFDKTLYKKTIKFLKHNDPKMVYIYGGIDPWGSSGVAGLKFLRKKDNIHVYVLPRGSHSTRINSFPEPQRSEIINLIKGWIGEK